MILIVIEKLTTRGRIGAVLIGAVLSVAMIEVPFRVLYHILDRPIGSKVAHSVYLPYVGYFREPGSMASTGLRADKHGFLLNSNDEKRDLTIKKPNEYRVFILGGSTVAGGLNRIGTLTAQLQTRLTRLFEARSVPVKPQVINAGVDGYFSAQQFLMFNFIILPLKPDYVIIFDGTNDFIVWGDYDHPSFNLLQNNYHDYQAEFLENYNNAFSVGGIAALVAKELGNYSAAMDFGYKLVSRSDRFQQILKTKIKGSDSFQSVITEFMPQHVDRYSKNIRSTLAISIAHQVPVTYVLQPTMLGEERLSPLERGIMNGLTTKWHNVDYFRAKRIFYRNSREMFENFRIEFGKSPSVTISDLSRLFTDKPDKISTFVDHIHYSTEGRRRIVDALFSVVKEPILKHALERSATVSNRTGAAHGPHD